MPAPKAVLRDLIDFGMDPAKPWSITHSKTGRLNPTPKPNAAHTGQHLNQVKFEPAKTAEAVKPVEKPTPKPVQVALKKLSAEPKVEAAVESPVPVTLKKLAEEVKVEAAVEAPVVEASKPDDEKPAS